MNGNVTDVTPGLMTGCGWSVGYWDDITCVDGIIGGGNLCRDPGWDHDFDDSDVT